MGKRERPILITGKTGTGKTTMAKSLVGENPLIFYADEIEDRDWKTTDSDIIIEEVHHKAKKDVIMNIIRHCKGQIILTSNDSSVSHSINSCSV